MSYIPCHERTFALRLAPRYEYNFWYYLLWLKQLLHRLGHQHTLAVWEEAFRDYDQELLVQILSSGWQETEESETEDVEKKLSDTLTELFPSPVEGISSKDAKVLLEANPPFRQIRQRLPTLNVQRQSSTYEALHLFHDPLALLAEALLDRYGKEGELVAYDAMLEEWPRGEEPSMSVEEFMTKRQARFGSGPEEPDIFSAGLEVELIRSSATEVVTRVTECEWARYFRERHPSVGYLLACSIDNAAYRCYNDRLRLQRTTNLMEGGTQCDFRVYATQ
jgi:hypothetical protein